MIKGIPYPYYSSNYHVILSFNNSINKCCLNLNCRVSNTKLTFLPESLTPNSNYINKDPSSINNNQNCINALEPSIRLNYFNLI